MSVPVKPTIEDVHSEQHVRIYERVFEGKGLILAGDGIVVGTTPDGQYIIKAKKFLASENGGFMGEYDPTKAYASGQTFLVSTATSIAGISVIAGLYGVPPGGVDVLGNTYAGYVPANPTGNAVPQSPLPAIGAAPNDKFYAKLILAGC